MSTALDTTVSIRLSIPVTGKIIIDCVYEMWSKAVSEGDLNIGIMDGTVDALVFRSTEGFDFTIMNDTFRRIMHGMHYEHILVGYEHDTNWCMSAAWKFAEALRLKLVTK